MKKGKQTRRKNGHLVNGEARQAKSKKFVRDNFYPAWRLALALFI
jgi:hypothetical protein